MFNKDTRIPYTYKQILCSVFPIRMPDILLSTVLDKEQFILILAVGEQ